MATILTCPGCGKMSQVGDLPGGSAVRCPHCMGVMLVPDVIAPQPSVEIAPPPSFEPPQPPEDHPQQSDDLMGLAAASSQSPPPDETGINADEPDPSDVVEVDESFRQVIASGPRRTKKQYGGLIIAGIVLLVAGGATFFFVTHQQNSSFTFSGASAPGVAPGALGDGDITLSEWEQTHAPQLSQWRSEAKSMEISGDLRGAQLRYQKMLDVAKADGQPSAGVAALLADAQRSFDSITSKIGPPPVVAVVPPPGSQGSAASTQPTAPAVAMAPTTVPASQPTTPVIADDLGANWEPFHRPQILQWAADADAFEKKNQPVEALARYQQIVNLVGDRRTTLKDSQLKTTVAAADASRKRLVMAVRGSDEAKAFTAKALLAGGLRAEQDGKWAAGLDALTDSSRLLAAALKPVDRYRDKTYLTCLDGMAVAYFNLKQVQKSGQLFDDDEPLGRGTLPTSDPSRTLIWNRAVNDITQKFNIMRAIKTIQGYMEKHHEDDEQMTNLLGTACFIADESNPPNRKVLDEAIGFYGQRSNDLERSRPGQRRWGIQWLPEADAQQKFDAYNKAIDDLQTKTREKTAAENHVNDLQTGAHRATAKELTEAKTKLTEATAAVKAAHDAIPRPPWLTDLQPIVPTLEEPKAAVVSADNNLTTPADSPTTPAQSTPAQSTPADPTLPSVSGPPPGTPAEPSTPAVNTTPDVPVAAAGRTAAAFAVDPTHLLTAAEPIGNATRVRVQDTDGNEYYARVAARSDHLALLEVSSSDANGSLPYLNVAPIFLEGGQLQCAAIPQASIFAPSAALISADAPVPNSPKWLVAMSDHPRLAGSPLLNASNQVVGVEIAGRDDPKQRIPAVTLAELQKFLQDNHATPATENLKPDPLAIYQVEAVEQ
jgi:hypothetical protein